ncbi:unnamed protein product [Effrenium voratum]|nr:unnamed protein product [Effrenium voratum]
MVVMKPKSEAAEAVCRSCESGLCICSPAWSSLFVSPSGSKVEELQLQDKHTTVRESKHVGFMAETFTWRGETAWFEHCAMRWTHALPLFIAPQLSFQALRVWRTPRRGVDEKVEQVEQYLRRIGGSARLRALKVAVGGISPDLLQQHFELTSDGVVTSKQGYQKHEVNIKEFLASKGQVPVATVSDTFRVPRRWLASHKDFVVRNGMIQLRVRPTGQAEVEIVQEYVGQLFALRPSDLTAQQSISRIRVFLMSKVASLPVIDRRNASALLHKLGKTKSICFLFIRLCGA